MSKAHVILNPAADRGHAGHRGRELREILKALGFTTTVERTLKPGHGAELARRAVQDGAPLVVAAGGDGTVNEVAQGVVGSDTALGVLPLGSGNDYIRILGIPKDLVGAAKVLARGRCCQVDVGLTGERYYLNSLGMGIDGQIARDYTENRWLKGEPGYYLAALLEIARFRAFRVEVTADTWTHSGRQLAVTVMNGPYAGGGFFLAPGAAVDDGQLDIALTGDYPRAVRLWVLPKTRDGSYLSLSRMRRERARRITIKTDRPVPVHMDGELLPRPVRELSVQLIPGGLTVVA
ncbi:MAG: diacylglycerol kinase family lipid kinase [Candidatus Bipolaricaulota bacterium]